MLQQKATKLAGKPLNNQTKYFWGEGGDARVHGRSA